MSAYITIQGTPVCVAGGEHQECCGHNNMSHAKAAAARLRKLGFQDVEVHEGGCPQYAKDQEQWDWED